MPGVATTRTYCWKADGQGHELNIVWVADTANNPYLFGRAPACKPVHVAGFYMAATAVDARYGPQSVC